MRFFFRIFRARCVVLSIYVLALVHTSCVKEEVEQVPAWGVEAAFIVSVPEMQTPSTRAFDPAQEKQVTVIDVVIFSNTTNTLLEHHRVVASDIDDGTGGNDYQFRVKGIENPENITLALIANAPNEVTTALGSTYLGMPKTTFLTALQASTNTVWNTSPGSYQTIPMYGEISVTGSIYGSATHSINLIRMLAKVDVVNSVAPSVPSTPANGDFELTKVHVVNRNTAGLIAPKWSSTTGAVETNPANEANFPAGFNPVTLSWIDGNELTYALVTGQTSIESEIYLFESNALSGNPSTPNGLRLVFEGNYTENGVTKRYFYPTDFTYPQKNGVTEYIPVLRNHRYLFTITEATGRGYDGLGEAVAASGVISNLKTSIIVVDESSIQHIVFNGQYMIGAENKATSVSKDAQDIALTVFTDNPAGWNASIKCEVADGNWLTFSGASFSSVPGKTTLNLSAALNATGAERTATVTFTAGRLTMDVTVTQSTISKYFIKITDEQGNEVDALTFDYCVGQPSVPAQNFYVSWNLPAQPCNISTMQTTGSNGAFVYATGSDQPGVNPVLITGGTQTFTISTIPASQTDLDNNPFFTKSSTLTFMVTDTYGNTVTRNFELAQGGSRIIASPASVYILDGVSLHSFKVKSNTLWAVRSVNDPNNILLNSTSQIADMITYQNGGPNISTGDDFTFTLMEDITGLLSGKSFTIDLYDPTGKAADVNVVINGISAYVIDRNNTHLYMWPYDQPTGYSWYDYANVPNGTNVMDVPPAGPQNATPHPASCAALGGTPEKPWRLPTRAEMVDMCDFFVDNGTYSRFGLLRATMGAGPGYWTATSNSITYAFWNRVDNGSSFGENSDPKTRISPNYPIYGARCVRTK